MRTFLGHQKRVKTTIVVLGIGAFSYLVGYIVSANSDAFAEAQRFVAQSPVATGVVGENLDVELSPFGYDLEFAGSGGGATFECDVSGSKTKGRVWIRLRKSAATWSVVEASLQANGQDIDLLEKEPKGPSSN